MIVERVLSFICVNEMNLRANGNMFQNSTNASNGNEQ